MLGLLALKVVLVVLFVCTCDVTCVDDIKDDTVEGGSDTGMWFGPRLGKRSQSSGADNDGETILKMLEAADAMKFYYDQMQRYSTQTDDSEKVSKKVVFTPKLGRAVEEEKTYDVDFTPRLGRRAERTPSDRDIIRNAPKVESRSQYFSPRLGRGDTHFFSPRLGRNIVYDFYPSSRVRFTRSANLTST